MKKVAGEQKTLGRVGGGKLTMEDMEVMISENAEVFKAAGYKTKQKNRII